MVMMMLIGRLSAALLQQTTCNASEYFTGIDAQWTCSAHDSNRVLRNSSGYEEKNRVPANAVIPGDIGYGVSPLLMSPAKGKEMNSRTL